MWQGKNSMMEGKALKPVPEPRNQDLKDMIKFEGAQGTADLCGILWLAFGSYKNELVSADLGVEKNKGTCTFLSGRK